MKKELPPPVLGEREPERTRWVTQVPPKRWYESTLAWIAFAIVAVAAIVAYANLG